MLLFRFERSNPNDSFEFAPAFLSFSNESSSCRLLDCCFFTSHATGDASISSVGPGSSFEVFTTTGREVITSAGTYSFCVINLGDYSTYLGSESIFSTSSVFWNLGDSFVF